MQNNTKKTEIQKEKALLSLTFQKNQLRIIGLGQIQVQDLYIQNKIKSEKYAMIVFDFIEDIRRTERNITRLTKLINNLEYKY